MQILDTLKKLDARASSLLVQRVEQPLKNWLFGRFKRLTAYWLAIWRHLLAAFTDVLIISVIILLPLVLSRLAPFARNEADDGDLITFWSIFASGQLALFVIGTVARVSLLCLHKGLPEGARVLFGSVSLLMLGFVTWLIGVDPKFANAPETFVGPTTGYLFIAAQTMAVIVVALSKMDPIDAPMVATAQANNLTDRLEASKTNENVDG